MSTSTNVFMLKYNWAPTCDFQQCGILTWIDSDEPMQPPSKLRNSKCSSVSSLTVIEYSSDSKGTDQTAHNEQADLSLCWSHIPHCWLKYICLPLLLIVGQFVASQVRNLRLRPSGLSPLTGHVGNLRHSDLSAPAKYLQTPLYSSLLGSWLRVSLVYNGCQ